MAFLDKVKKTAQDVAKKSNTMVEVTKLNASIKKERDKINSLYIEIGKKIFNDFSSGNEVGDDVKDECENIVKANKQVDELNEKVRILKNVKICPECGAELELQTSFCSKCGAKQEIPQPKAEAATGKKCGACGADVAADTKFCPACGAAVE